MNKPKNKGQKYRFVLKHHFQQKWLTAFHAQMLCALALWSGQTVGQEIPWHLGRLDGAQAAPAAINTAGHQPGPYPVVVAVVDSGVMPDHPSLQALLQAHGRPLLATTLIPPGQTEALNDAEEIREKYEKALSAVMDAGACSLEPTTVVDLTPMDLGGEPQLVRKGRGELHLLNL
jgi:hypothetical protein